MVTDRDSSIEAGAAVGAATAPEQIVDLGEDALVRRVVERYPPAPHWLRVGPGDDAAVLALGESAAAGLVVSIDTMVQGHDFRLDWSSGFEIGVKLAAQNLADIAAMGARPRALLVSLTAPATTSAAFVEELASGLADECGRCAAAVVGGDVSDGSMVVLTGTALGVLEDGVRPVRRSGANVGDVVALSGVCGPSGAGLDLLLAGIGSRGGAASADGTEAALQRLLRAHRAPRPDYAAGMRAAKAGASAMIDTSDGLVRDAARIALASRVTVAISTQRLPSLPELAIAAAALGRGTDAVRAWQLGGGEDHGLLACFPDAATLPPGFTAIGRVRSQGEQPVLVDGEVPEVHGWRHWS